MIIQIKRMIKNKVLNIKIILKILKISWKHLKFSIDFCFTSYHKTISKNYFLNLFSKTVFKQYLSLPFSKRTRPKIWELHWESCIKKLGILNQTWFPLKINFL